MIEPSRTGESQPVTLPAILREIDPSKIDFSVGLACVNRTQRFVLPIPELPEGGELLVFPEGTAKEGQAIKTNPDGSTARGIVFFNGKDQAWQAVRGDGKGVIIINEVSAEEAASISLRLETLKDENLPEIDRLKQLLSYARDSLGFIDFYNSNAESVAKNLRTVGADNPHHYQVTKDTVHRAVYITEAFTVKGPVQQVYPDGGVILNDGAHSWGIEKGVFLRNFRAIDNGFEVPVSELPPLAAFLPEPH